MPLLAPLPPLPLTRQARIGQKLFSAIGCANCHRPTLQTGPSPIPQLNNATFHPFSDFLLHDMGSLGDGIAQAGAGQTEMRTSPLRGVRVLTTFLHDGRATTLSQAILAHAGQGAAAAEASNPALEASMLVGSKVSSRKDRRARRSMKNKNYRRFVELRFRAVVKSVYYHAQGDSTDVFRWIPPMR
jgi:cytochrome c peroxidase